MLATTSINTSTWIWRSHNIRYAAVGAGKPLILIHGFGASIGHWRHNIPTLAAAGYRVYALDLLGFGGSAKPPLDYSLDLWQELLEDFWREHVGKPAVFVGNSIGALLCLMMAAYHPKLVDGVVLINAAGGLNHRPHELNPVLRFVMGTFATLVGSEWAGPLVFNTIRQKHRIRSTLYQVYCDRTAVTDELVDMLYQPSCDPGAQKVFASILTAPPGPHPTELLPKIDCPLLVLWGEKDPWTPIAGSRMYQELSRRSDRVTFVSIPEAGHCPHDEKPKAVNAEIVAWLNQLS